MGQFARMLPDLGWDVTVLTARDRQGKDRDMIEQLAKRVQIVEAWSPSGKVVQRGIPAPLHGARGAARRALRFAMRSVLFPDREIFWVPAALSAGHAALAATPHDAILATYGPASDLVVGHALARHHGLPLILDYRDLWATLPVAIFPTPVHRAAARQLERKFVRDAARVIAVAQGMADDLATTHGISHDRVVEITNGFDPEHARRVRDDRGSSPRPFRLIYTGSVNANYDLGTFWRVVRELADAGKITPETLRIEFVGNLAMSDVRAFGVDAFVDTRPFVAHSEVFDVLARADALLMMETVGYYARYSYAAKVFDYLLSGKPVLALVEPGGNSARLLESAGVGYVAEPGNADAIRQRFEQVLALKDAPPRRVDPDAPPYAAFNRKHLVAKLAGVLDDVTQKFERIHISSSSQRNTSV